MGLLVRHSAGRRSCSRKKMLGLFLWFIFSEMFGDVFSSAALASKGKSNTPPSSSKGENKNNTSMENNAESSVYTDLNSNSYLHRVSKALPQDRNSYENLVEFMLETDKYTEDVQKAPTTLKTLFVIPYLRPGRSDTSKEIKIISKIPNTVISVERSGKPVSNVFNENSKSASSNNIIKRYDSFLPSFRFHAEDEKTHTITPNVLFEQSNSDSFNGEDGANFSLEESIGGDYFYGSTDKETKYDNKEDFEDSAHSVVRKKRETGSYDTIIPYPRAGRTAPKNSKGENIKEESKQSVFDILSTIQNSRRMDVFASPAIYESEKPNPSSYVLPYPRPGRSNNYNGETESSENFLDSQFNSALELSDVEEGNDTMEQQSAALSQAFIKKSLEKEGRKKSTQELFSGSFIVRPYLKGISQKSKDSSDDSTPFIIPYPRPGKKSMLIINSPRVKQKSDKEGEGSNDYVVPYPRPGKKSFPRLLVKNFKNNDIENEIAQKYIVPYPRPGRSQFVLDDMEDEINQDINEDDEYAVYDENNDSDLMLSATESLKSEIDTTDSFIDNSFHLTYKRSNVVIPYPRLGRSAYVSSYPVSENAISSPRLKRSNSILPYPRAGRSKSDVPYTRLRKSDSVVPYPRLGRSNSVVPYPRLGRSESALFSKLSRSNTIVPLPRPGRSDSVVPYPRPGRSDSVVPYPRLGRSDSVVPYPRLGRSDAVVPYPRFGRSFSVVPYPRPGRSESIVPYPRLGRSDSVVPYPRLGRSDSVVPYPRPGRSNSVVPYPRLGRSNSVVPYPRLGRSISLKPYLEMDRSLSTLSSQNEKKPLSLSVYQRESRSDKPNPPLKNDVKMGKWILPNIRPGRSESKKAIFFIVSKPKTDGIRNSQYPDSTSAKRFLKAAVVVDPRLRRSERERMEYIWPQTESVVDNEKVLSARNIADTVIPYPRLGRSEEQVTPSPDLMNTAHKLNKHMLSSAGDSVYLLPYPRPGRGSF